MTCSFLHAAPSCLLAEVALLYDFRFRYVQSAGVGARKPLRSVQGQCTTAQRHGHAPASMLAGCLLHHNRLS